MHFTLRSFDHELAVPKSGTKGKIDHLAAQDEAGGRTRG